MHTAPDIRSCISASLAEHTKGCFKLDHCSHTWLMHNSASSAGDVIQATAGSHASLLQVSPAQMLKKERTRQGKVYCQENVEEAHGFHIWKAGGWGEVCGGGEGRGGGGKEGWEAVTSILPRRHSPASALPTSGEAAKRWPKSLAPPPNPTLIPRLQTCTSVLPDHLPVLALSVLGEPPDY